MNGSEKWWASRGVWGGIISALGGLAGLIGLQVTPEDQAALTGGVVNAALWIQSGVTIFGGFLAVWGRMRATKTIE